VAGIFTISLDFELHWGVFDKRNRAERLEIYKNTVGLIPQLLQLFEKYKVRVTWATVASLFARSEEDWYKLHPHKKPNYNNSNNSAFDYIENNGLLPEAHLSADAVKKIEQFEGQELSTHTFSHYYCLEKGQTAQDFDADLKAVIKACAYLGVKEPVSIVFPRNQYNADYLSVCYNNGIKIIRSNPEKWFWTGIANEDTSLPRKIMRTGDTYLPIGGKMTYPLTAIKKANGMPLELPASRLLRTYDANKKFLNTLRTQRILGEMKYAAVHNECYHLWWHPEQFGAHPKQSMEELEVLLQHFQQLQKKYAMRSLNMEDFLAEL
jgi:peptidoglycan/xylan/chitin deacetylase (PgdA/CDA1 family)